MFNIDIQYTWLLLFLPLVVAAFNWFLLTRRPNVAALTSTFSCLATFVLSLGLLDQTRLRLLLLASDLRCLFR